MLSSTVRRVKNQLRRSTSKQTQPLGSTQDAEVETEKEKESVDQGLDKLADGVLELTSCEDDPPL